MRFRRAPRAVSVSLLDNGRETVTVYPEVDVEDADGNKVKGPAADGISITCSVQPVRGEKDVVLGQQTAEVYRVRPNRFETVPVGPWAKVAWAGVDWDVELPPLRNNGSDATRHVVFYIKSRGGARPQPAGG